MSVLTTIVLALGLVLVVEGLLYALFPEQAQRFAALATQMDPQTLRNGGVAALAIGVFLVWLTRGGL